MKTVSHKKTLNAGVDAVHVEPLPIHLIKSKRGDKSEKDFVKLKLCRYLVSDNLDLYGFNMALFYNGKSKEFLLFVHNFNMTLGASVTLGTDVKVQNLRTLSHGEA